MRCPPDGGDDTPGDSILRRRAAELTRRIHPSRGTRSIGALKHSLTANRGAAAAAATISDCIGADRSVLPVPSLPQTPQPSTLNPQPASCRQCRGTAARAGNILLYCPWQSSNTKTRVGRRSSGTPTGHREYSRGTMVPTRVLSRQCIASHRPGTRCDSTPSAPAAVSHSSLSSAHFVPPVQPCDVAARADALRCAACCARCATVDCAGATRRHGSTTEHGR